MKVMIIGLGSMGKRRIRLIKRFNEDYELIGIDANEERCLEVKRELNIACCLSIGEALQSGKIDCAFVCTSPLSHYEIISKLLEEGLPVFTEINLSDEGYDELIEYNNRNNGLFLSSTFLYREDIQYIINMVKGHKVNYIYHTGQYLPDWHPWESYKNYFVKDKRTNGCREILAIELPWILKCFGNVASVKVIKDNLSSLELDYYDNYSILVEHDNGSKGYIAVDVVARKPTRRLEIYNEDIHLFWDGTPQTLFEYDWTGKQLKHIKTYENILKDNKYCDNIIENAYMDEIIAFFDKIQGKKEREDRQTLVENREVLRLINLIEQTEEKI